MNRAPSLRRLATADLTAAEVGTIRELLRAAFAQDGEGFTDADWAHAVGGLHVLLEVGGEIVSHASVVERRLHAGGRAVRTGYVEAVATRPEDQGRGFGSRVMTEVGAHVRDAYELGALGTGRDAFYERLGWIPWTGPTWVRSAHGEVRTPEDDGAIFVLLTPTSPPLDPAGPIACEWRPGDVW